MHKCLVGLYFNLGVFLRVNTKANLITNLFNAKTIKIVGSWWIMVEYENNSHFSF